MIDEKVIIVGNSPEILKKNYGKLIDSYDIVIRINNCPTKGFEEQIGTKINIWATTKNTQHKDNFYPENIDNLDEIWLRTPKTERSLKVPDNKVSKRVMYKTKWFRKKFNSYLNKDNWFLLGTNSEMCTGLMTILTATSIYKNVHVYGFTFYEESKGEVTAYYRESQKNKAGDHFEDQFWQKAKKIGFTSENNAKIKHKILKNLSAQGIIKIIN